MTREEADEFTDDIIEAVEDKRLSENDVLLIINDLNSFLSFDEEKE